MKIYEFIKLKNKKVTVKSSRVRDVKRYYLGMYRSYMIYLYDQGFISDPTVFNETEIRANIVEMGIHSIVNTSGKVMLTSEYAKYAKAYEKNNVEEVQIFLDLLYNALKYREISLNLDKFYDVNLFATDTKRKVGLNMIQSGARVTNKNGYHNDEGVLKCFYPYGYEFGKYSINDNIYARAVKKLGIEDDISDLSGQGLFVKGLTILEEIESSYLILNGFVLLDGKHAKVLEDWLHENKWSDGNRFSHQNEGLYNWVLRYDSDNTMNEQSKVLNEFLDEGRDVVCLEEDCFYVLEKDADVQCPIGQFSVLSSDSEDELLPFKNNLEGYTGQVYAKDYLEKEGIDYVGCPIELYINDKDKCLVVDFEQTEFNGQDTWFSDQGVTIDFGDIEEVEVSSDNKYELDLFNFYRNAESGIVIGVFDKGIKEQNIEEIKKSVSKVIG